MPDIQPELSAPGSSKIEVGQFYKGLSKHSHREVNIGTIHQRQQNLIERFATLWKQDQEQANQPYTGFQTRIIELHNNRNRFGQDPEDATRLFAFLSVFGDPSETHLDDKAIQTITQGTFKNSADVSNFVARAFEGDKKWLAEYGKFRPFKNKLGLKREGDQYKLAELTREELANEQFIFRAAFIPHSQFENLGLQHRLFIHLAKEYKQVHLSDARKDVVKKIESSGLTKFDVSKPKELLAFIEKGTSTNIESILEQNAAEKVALPDKIKNAREKGFTALADAAEETNQKRLYLNAAQRHSEIIDNLDSLEDYLKWIHPDLDFTQASKFETILAIARNDHFLYEKLAQGLGLKKTASIDTLLEAISNKDPANLEAIADTLDTWALQGLKTGPFYLKVDAAQDLISRRFEQISTERAALPKFEFDKLNPDKVTDKHVAVLLGAGYQKEELEAQGIKTETIDQAVNTYFKTDEENDPILDNGKYQWKEDEKDADYKQAVKDKKELPQYLLEAQTKVKDTLGNNNKQVLEEYRALAQAQAASESERFAGTRDYTSTYNTTLQKYWSNNRPVTTNDNHNTWIEVAKANALESEEIKKQVVKVQEELRDKAINKYQRGHIRQSELASLGEINLAALVSTPDSGLTINSLPEPAKTNTRELLENGQITKTKLKEFIANHPHLAHGSDLSVLFTLFDALQDQVVTSALSDKEHDQLAQMAA